MREITNLMNAYRECSRDLWNNYLSGKRNIGASLDAFSQIQKILFETLVVNELDYDGDDNVEDLHPPVLVIVPGERSQILIERLSPPGEATYWGEVKDMFVSAKDIRLEFTELFNFGQMPSPDFSYYLCKITSFPSHSEYEGRRALIEVLNGRVFHDESR